MPLVTIKTGFQTPDGKEETLTQYLCDWPGCPNAAVRVLGVSKELRLAVVMCQEHAPPQRRTTEP